MSILHSNSNSSKATLHNPNKPATAKFTQHDAQARRSFSQMDCCAKIGRWRFWGRLVFTLFLIFINPNTIFSFSNQGQRRRTLCTQNRISKGRNQCADDGRNSAQGRRQSATTISSFLQMHRLRPLCKFPT